MATNVTDAELMEKFKGKLAQVREEIAAVKARYAQNSGPHLSEAEWWCVEQEARAYTWAYLRTRGIDAPALVPGTVVEIAMSNCATGTAGQYDDAEAAKELMERFNKITSAVEAAVAEIISKDPHLSAVEAVALAERQVALRYPMDCPLYMRGEQPQVN